MTKYGTRNFLAGLVAVTAAVALPAQGFAHREGYCDGYAEDYADHRANGGNVLAGTLLGAGTGAVIGSIVGGRRSVGEGALIGAVGGTIIGGVHTDKKWRKQYKKGYAKCMDRYH